MNDFVNPNQRGMSLPPGCKDLIDVLRPRVPPEAVSCPGTDSQGGLSEVAGYVTKLVNCRAEYGVLMIGASEAGRPAITLYRNAGTSVISCFYLGVDVQRERGIREILERRGSGPTNNEGMEPGPGQEETKVLACGLPASPPDAVELVLELLRRGYGFTEESTLQFLSAEHGAAGT